MYTLSLKCKWHEKVFYNSVRKQPWTWRWFLLLLKTQKNSPKNELENRNMTVINCGESIRCEDSFYWFSREWLAALWNLNACLVLQKFVLISIAYGILLCGLLTLFLTCMSCHRSCREWRGLPYEQTRCVSWYLYPFLLSRKFCRWMHLQFVFQQKFVFHSFPPLTWLFPLGLLSRQRKPSLLAKTDCFGEFWHQSQTPLFLQSSIPLNSHLKTFGLASWIVSD